MSRDKNQPKWSTLLKDLAVGHPDLIWARESLISTVANLFVTLIFLGAIKIIEHFTTYLWPDDKVFFGVLPMSYVLDFASIATLGVLVAFAILGLLRLVPGDMVRSWIGRLRR
jgi:hypothetical protein